MTEFFAIFGMLCVYTAYEPKDIKCMNFWEEPVIKYEKIETCGKEAKRRGREIENDFIKNGLISMNFNIEY